MKKKNIISAANRGRIEDVKELLDAGDDPNTRAEYGNTPVLGIACHKGHHAVVRELLERGADPNLVDDMGRNALIRCAENGSVEIASLLIERGANANVVSNVGMDIIQTATICENFELVEYFKRL